MRWTRVLIVTGLLILASVATFILVGDRLVHLGHGGTLTAVAVCVLCALLGAICSLVGTATGLYALVHTASLRTQGNVVLILAGFGAVTACAYWLWPK